ncbi:MAG: hypothetical protein O9308_08115 [Beijerinckiaceae bacterium]|nr:hypothetical protein [Beijerinckiaceae bacterium]
MRDRRPCTPVRGLPVTNLPSFLLIFASEKDIPGLFSILADSGATVLLTLNALHMLGSNPEKV